MSKTYALRPLFDPESATWTYILVDRGTRQAAVIDPVLEQSERDLRLLEEMDVTPVYVLETHVHADHVTGASFLKDRTGAKIVYGAGSRAVEGADLFLENGQTLAIGKTIITALATPGHTDGCTSYAVDGAVFTGDALLIRGCGRTDFQEGSADKLYDSIHDRLFTLPDDTVVYPAHDYKGMLCSTIGEEKRFNPRLGDGIDKPQFIRIMQELGLPHPRKIDIAVPANLRAGRAA